MHFSLSLYLLLLLLCIPGDDEKDEELFSSPLIDRVIKQLRQRLCFTLSDRLTGPNDRN